MLVGGAELGDRERTEHQRGPQRDRCDASALLLQQQAQLDEPVSTAAEVLGQAQPEQVGLGQLVPQGVVESVVVALDVLDPLDGRVALEDLPGEVLDDVLLVAEIEVHRSSCRVAGVGSVSVKNGSASSSSTRSTTRRTRAPMTS